MELLVPLMLVLVALAFIFMPLWAGETQLRRRPKAAALFSRDQLELDRELGKIDAAEYDELTPQMAANEAEPPRAPLEALIAAVRRQKRLDTTLEVEVLVARARKNRH